MDLKELAKSRNAKNVFCNRLGIQIQDIAPGRAVVVKTVGPEDVNPLGIPHGGVYFSMADTACGTAMATHGYAAVTMDANYHFLKSAAVGDTLTAESCVVRSGRTIGGYDVRITNQDGTLLGTGTFTFYRLDQKLTV